MKKLWEKGYDVNREVEAFTIGRDRELDLLLARYDVLGTLAHARMLQSIGILSEEEWGSLKPALLEILQQVEESKFSIPPGVEDVHSQLENMLTDRLGETGKKVHTGRSRNDQVALDLHLYIREEIRELVLQTGDLFNALLLLAGDHRDKRMPGYTHFQVAMPASAGLWFASFAEDLCDDLLLLQSAYRMANQNPLGAAAGFGTSIPLDRRLTTRLMGFDTMRYNTMHAMMSRGRLEKATAQAISGVAGTLARLAMDVTLYMGQDYDFISFPEEYTTGSSIMPHKKNPDVFELIRARCNRLKSLPYETDLVIGNLPSGYHRDYQVLKENFLPAFSDLRRCIRLAEQVILRVEVRGDILKDPKYQHISSVDKLNELVMQGLPFREAYQVIAQQIRNQTFNAGTAIKHSHEGSIDRLCLEEIAEKRNRHIEAFGFERVQAAMEQLTHSPE